MTTSIAVPTPSRLALQATLAAAALMAAGSGWAGVTQGTSFGTIVDAGGLKQGGAFQYAASVSRSSDEGNTSATAAGATHGFSLHAWAWTSQNPKLPGYCTVYTCTWQTYANVTVWDTITLTAPVGGPPENLTFDFHIDGTKTRGPWAYGDGAYAYASYYFGLDPNGWSRAPTITLASGETELGGIIQAPAGTSFTVYLMGSLSVSARSGAEADYSHTMAFHLDLPEGWTYTSASGHFSPAPSPVPEPASLALMLGGLVGVAAVKRRRVPGCQADSASASDSDFRGGDGAAGSLGGLHR